MRPDHWKLEAAIAAVQHGLVTRAQTLATGVAPRTLNRAVEAGLLTTVRRGVYRVRGVPCDVWEALAAACLAGAPGTVASHRAAAGLHRFPGILPGAVEVSTGRGAKRALTGVRCHSSVAPLLPGDVRMVRNIPTVSPARTIVDLAPVLDARLLARIVDHAGRHAMCSPSEVGAVLARVGGPGRSGTATLRGLIADRVEGDSELEATWLRRLRRAGLDPPALQHQVVVRRRVLILDLAWPQRGVGVEVDGWEPHGTRSAWDHDHDKANGYAEAGWKVLFVTSRTPVADVVRQLRQFLSE